MKKVQLINPETVGKMFEVKNELVATIKEIVKDEPIRDMNLVIFCSTSGKPLTIKDVYLDTLEKKLSLRTDNEKRMCIDNPLEGEAEEMESISLTISELTRIISYVENKIMQKENAKEAITIIAKENDLEVTIK